VSSCLLNLHVYGADPNRSGTFSHSLLTLGVGAWEASMSLFAWIVLGLISGFIASKIVNKSGAGALMDIALGIVGAVLGGWLFNTIGHVGVTGLNLYSILVAVVGAVIVLILYETLFRSRTHA
jgi:uncharacterized membrane protein YeaQ/YmgE (transglycosylase-associated protein family)